MNNKATQKQIDYINALMSNKLATPSDSVEAHTYRGYRHMWNIVHESLNYQALTKEYASSLIEALKGNRWDANMRQLAPAQALAMYQLADVVNAPRLFGELTEILGNKIALFVAEYIEEPQPGRYRMQQPLLLAATDFTGMRVHWNEAGNGLEMSHHD